MKKPVCSFPSDRYPKLGLVVVRGVIRTQPEKQDHGRLSEASGNTSTRGVQF